MTKETQKERILEYIREHGSITPVEALKHIGSFRLGARIYDLKQQGHDIINLNKTGDERYAKYAMRRNISPVKPSEKNTDYNSMEHKDLMNRYKLLDDNGKIDMIRTLQRKYPENSLQYKRISEQIEKGNI